ncbi:MAG: lipoate--protein ligase family protein [Pseudomonadota bacterium]|nr:lipoate--protein ligase family protein [Pseudomonadota bacterium]
MPQFRVIDSGVRDGRMQIAFDQALIDLHRAGRVPDTVRFLRFPPTVLIGRHQALSQEVKLEHVRDNGIGLVRRITGGGAIYLDEGQLGWELVFRRSSLPLGTLADYTAKICEAVATGLSAAFGIDARFRPRNDIEVDGRKLCGTGGFFDGDTLIYQGTVLIDMDPAAMVACLNVPQAKLQKRDLDSAANRVTTLKQLLGSAPPVNVVQAAVLEGLRSSLGIVGEPQVISNAENAHAKEIFDDEIGQDSFVAEIDRPDGAGVLSGQQSGPGGTVTAYVRLEGPGRGDRIREVLFTGDFFVTPPRLVFDLEAALRGVPTAKAFSTVLAFFANRTPDMLSIRPEDFAAAVGAALGIEGAMSEPAGT